MTMDVFEIQIQSVLNKYAIKGVRFERLLEDDCEHLVGHTDAQIPDRAWNEIGNLETPRNFKFTVKDPASPPFEVCEICRKKFEFKKRDGSSQVANSIFDKNSPTLQRLMWAKVPHKECAAKEQELAKKKFEDSWIAERKQVFFSQINSALRTMPSDADGKRFETYRCGDKNKRSLDLLGKWRPHHNFGFALIGPTGTGKTHLMTGVYNTIRDEWEAICAATSDFWDHEKDCVGSWWNVTELIRQIRFEEVQGGHDTTFKLVRNSKYLFLDDLATGKISDYTAEMIYLILEHRKNKELPTFITTNVEPKDLAELLHDRVASRIKEMCVPLQIQGEDFRGEIMNKHIQELDSWGLE